MQRTATLEEQAAVHPWLRWRLTHESQLPNVAPESDDDLALLRSQCASDPLRIHLATRFSLAEDNHAPSSDWACCAEVDAQLGRLFDFLKERGEWDRTLVIFTGPLRPSLFHRPRSRALAARA